MIVSQYFDFPCVENIGCLCRELYVFEDDIKINDSLGLDDLIHSSNSYLSNRHKEDEWASYVAVGKSYRSRRSPARFSKFAF